MGKTREIGDLVSDNLFSTDISNDRVGIGSTQPSTKLDVNGTVTATSFSGDGSNLTGIANTANINSDTIDTGSLNVTGITTLAGNTNISGDITSRFLTIVSTDSGSSAEPIITLRRDSSSPAADDQIGQLRFTGENSSGQVREYASITGKIVSPTLLAEKGAIETRINGFLVSTQTSTLLDLQSTVNVSGALTATSLAINDFDIKRKSGDTQITNNTGDLLIFGSGGSNTIKIQPDAANNSITANSGGSVELFFNNVKKLETVSSGVDITGSLDVSGQTILGGVVYIADEISHTGDTDTSIRFPSNDTFTIETAGSERVRIDSTGIDVLFDTSAGNRHFFTSGALGTRLQRRGDTVGWAMDYGFETNNGTDVGGFGAYGNNTGLLRYYIGSSYLDTKFVIESGGDVGIGTNNPGYKLEVNGDIKVGELGTLWFSDVSGSIEKITATGSSIDIYSDSLVNFYESDANTLQFTVDTNNARAYFQNDTDTYWYRPSANTHAWTTDGTERFRIDSAGTSTFTGNITVSNTAPLIIFSETDTTSQGRIVESSGDFYIQAGASGSGGSGSGNIRFTGYNAVDIGSLTVKTGGAYNTIWHAGNDGSGSGLDADTLDGINSASFLRTDADTTKTSGQLLLNDSVPIRFGTGADAQMFHNGSDMYFDFQVAGDSWFFRDSGDSAIFGFAESTGNLSLYKGSVLVGDGGDQSTVQIKKADNDVADHIQFFNGTTRMGEIGVRDTTWLRINQETAKNIFTPRYIRADGGFFVDGTSKGINGSGNFIGGTIAGASDYDLLATLAGNQTFTGALSFSGGLGITGGPGTIAGATFANGWLRIGSSTTGWAFDNNELVTFGACIVNSASGSTMTFSNRPAFNGGTSGSTSPFTVDSTQVVTNLNADLLDGIQASSFLRSDTASEITAPLTIDSDNNVNGALRIENIVSNTNNDFYFAQEIIQTLSGSQVATSDREQGGIYMDINSTNTGGDTSNEHRAYGIYIDLDSTGDADVVNGIYANATATPTTGTTSNVWAGYFFAEDNGGAGAVSTVYGVQAFAYSDNSNSDTNTQFAGYFKAYCAADSAAVGTAYGVYSEIEINGTTDLYGVCYASRASIDNNTNVAQTNSSYLYYGDYQGTLPTTAYGVYIATNVESYFAGPIVSAQNITAFSDITLKENIEVIPNALDKVSQIRGITFDRIDIDDEPRQSGVIAQEVEKVLPEVVRTSQDGTKTVAYGNMVGLLIEAIKEQQKQIDDLKAKLEEGN